MRRLLLGWTHIFFGGWGRNRYCFGSFSFFVSLLNCLQLSLLLFELPFKLLVSINFASDAATGIMTGLVGISECSRASMTSCVTFTFDWRCSICYWQILTYVCVVSGVSEVDWSIWASSFITFNFRYGPIIHVFIIRIISYELLQESKSQFAMSPEVSLTLRA